uniref:Uncharacterized protein n=1 Tax=Arundo donax TaxID=35708 RepID=A0A0A9FHE9_ARUDO
MVQVILGCCQFFARLFFCFYPCLSHQNIKVNSCWDSANLGNQFVL